jgi:hypothetical protein
MASDLSQFATKKKASDGAKMTVINPQTDKPLIDPETDQPVTITLIGADSDEYKRILHAQQNKVLKQASRTGKLAKTAESIESDALELLVKSTKGWEGISIETAEDGKAIPLPFNEANARRLYETVPFLRDQASDFINDRNNFLGN